MTYFKKSLYLTDSQLKKISAAANADRSVSIRVDPTIRGTHDLYLTQTQINKLSDGKKHDLVLSKTQLGKNGGFVITIPLLLAGLSAAAAISGAAGGIARTVNQKKHEKNIESETKRHNEKVEKLMLNKKGEGAFLPRKRF